MSEAPDEPKPQTNASALDALLDEVVEKFEGPSVPRLPDDRVAQLVGLALDPATGEAITLGGRTFTLRFLTIDTERALHGLLRSQGRIDIIGALILRDQAPDVDAAWIHNQAVPPAELLDLIERQQNLNDTVHGLRDTLDARRTDWSARGRQGPGIEYPPDVRQTMFVEWACRTFAAHPQEIYRHYSQALLLVLFDAWWWVNCASPPENAQPGDPVGSDGNAGG